MPAVPLRPSVSPNLLVSESEYNQQRQELFKNQLRVYFNQIDNFTQNSLVPPSGTTANRPTIGLQVGQYYFDTTFGLPVYYNGIEWITAAGEVLVSVVGVFGTGTVRGVTINTVQLVGVSGTGQIGPVTVVTVP